VSSSSSQKCVCGGYIPRNKRVNSRLGNKREREREGKEKMRCADGASSRHFASPPSPIKEPKNKSTRVGQDTAAKGEMQTGVCLRAERGWLGGETYDFDSISDWIGLLCDLGLDIEMSKK